MVAAEQARRELIRAGFGAYLSAAAAASGAVFGSSTSDQRALLEEIARYIDSSDPQMIGGAWLLEQAGYERSQLSFLLEETGT